MNMNKTTIVAGVALLAVLLAVPPFLKSYGIYLLSYWLVFVIANMGLNLTVGYAGSKFPLVLAKDKRSWLLKA